MNYFVPNSSSSSNAVAHWYDSKHEDSGTTDEMSLALWDNDLYQQVVASSDDPSDNKQRVFYSDWSTSGDLSLKIVGENVTSDDEGCGTNSNRVYVAYLFEDSDRDDSDGPGCEILPENCYTGHYSGCCP